MTRKTHTPGPWELTKYAYSNAWSVQGWAGKIGLPNETGYVCLATPAPHYDAAVQEANARLICASPKMLATLKSVEKMIKFLADETFVPVESREHTWNETLLEVRRAIAEATGNKVATAA